MQFLVLTNFSQNFTMHVKRITLKRGRLNSKYIMKFDLEIFALKHFVLQTLCELF